MMLLLLEVFNACVLQGNIKGALRCLSHSVTGGVLSLTDSVSSLGVGHTVRDILLDKHPSGQLVDPSILLPDTRIQLFLRI